MKPVRTLIFTGLGINCEGEMAAAYRLAGASADIVHINDLFHTGISIHTYHILNFPGGFSFGDDLGAGRALANRLKYRRLPAGNRFIDELIVFIENGNFILGICNGFQVLVNMGILPNIRGAHEQEVALAPNDSGRFEDRWCTCGVRPDSRSPFFSGIQRLDLPVRHGEGKLVVSDPTIRDEIDKHGLACLYYSDECGHPTDRYPLNPNGSLFSCAGLIDTTGRILGMMPHPEAYLSSYNHPHRAELPAREATGGDGLLMFRNIVDHISSGRTLHNHGG